MSAPLIVHSLIRPPGALARCVAAARVVRRPIAATRRDPSSIHARASENWLRGFVRNSWADRVRIPTARVRRKPDKQTFYSPVVSPLW